MSQPTPIRISRRTRTALLVLGLIALALFMWAAPTVPVVLLGGFALALVLSFPVRWLSPLMPRWLAMLITFLLLAGIVSLAFLVLVPILIVQLVSFVKAAPHIATAAQDTLRSLLQPLTDSGILKETPDQFMVRLGRDLLDLAQSVGQQVLGRLVGFVSGTISVVLTLFGILFVSVYFLANVRKIKATFLMAAPKRYRRDAAELWESEGVSLSRYLSGLGLDMLIQGAISSVGLFLLGVPYALLLGTWVAVAAVIPYLGAWLGAIPAVIVALTVSPAKAFLTALLYLVVQQIEGNVLQPRIQGQALNMPSILIFLGVIAGAEIAGLLGVIFAVPTLAVLKVLFDFFRARLYTEEQRTKESQTPSTTQHEQET
ncbi:MAG TPA: AI-2E family transporter [Rubrobacter sp.]|nr:AI-2E family transporter [Rubrobacter sp.]